MPGKFDRNYKWSKERNCSKCSVCVQLSDIHIHMQVLCGLGLLVPSCSWYIFSTCAVLESQALYCFEGSGPQYLNSIFGKIEILVSKWCWQHQLFQGNKILTPTWSIFTQYINVRSLPGNLPAVLHWCVGQQYLNSRTYDNVVIEFTWALQGVCLCSEPQNLNSKELR